MKFLIDQNADFFGNELKKLHYDVEYVADLRKKDEKFRNDLNVMRYAEINKMILITKDRENGQACKDNNITCIWITDEKIFEKIIQPELNVKLIEKVDTESTDDEILDDFNKIKSGEASRMAQKSSG
jgi:predicted nuclease of predicted toxin-antitoxin system